MTVLLVLLAELLKTIGFGAALAIGIALGRSLVHKLTPDLLV